jgi:hypothetical protein
VAMKFIFFNSNVWLLFLLVGNYFAKSGHFFDLVEDTIGQTGGRRVNGSLLALASRSEIVLTLSQI